LEARSSVPVRHLGGEREPVQPTDVGVFVVEVTQGSRIEVQHTPAGVGYSRHPGGIGKVTAANAHLTTGHAFAAQLGLIWVFAGVAGDRKRSLLINGPSVEIGSDRF
jgi:hypothetical protein